MPFYLRSQSLFLPLPFLPVQPTAFWDMHKEGLIFPAKAREGLRAWRSLSKLAGADVTDGVAGVNRVRARRD